MTEAACPLPYGYCGISCALCNRHLVNGPSACAGCSQDGYYAEPCKIAKCCRERGLLHCALCPEYPCARVGKIGDFSDLQTDRHFEKNCRRIAVDGFDGWYEAYRERAALLERALTRYNNGRMKRYLCELFLREDLSVLRAVMDRAEGLGGAPKERAAKFREIAEEMRRTGT